MTTFHGNEGIEYERALVNTIKELKQRVLQAEAELLVVRRKMGMPEACGHLGCDPRHTNLRCMRLKNHAGNGDAWSSEFTAAYANWRDALEKEGTDT